MSAVIAPIILIILTIWAALALASPVSAASPEMPSHCVVTSARNIPMAIGTERRASCSSQSRMTA
jgi:hypothetical protein